MITCLDLILAADAAAGDQASASGDHLAGGGVALATSAAYALQSGEVEVAGLWGLGLIVLCTLSVLNCECTMMRPAL